MISTINATVEVIENLGNELLVYLNSGGKSIQARLNPRSRVSVGNQITLQVDTARIHLFDSETEVAYF